MKERILVNGVFIPVEHGVLVKEGTTRASSFKPPAPHDDRIQTLNGTPQAIPELSSL
jgi:hypothetical protein